MKIGKLFPSLPNRFFTFGAGLYGFDTIQSPIVSNTCLQTATPLQVLHAVLLNFIDNPIGPKQMLFVECQRKRFQNLRRKKRVVLEN